MKKVHATGGRYKMDGLLKATSLLDYRNSEIQRLIDGKGWARLDAKNKILSTYNFVRDEIRFGYNADDCIPASQVLADGVGQCNTKGILLMALLRAVGIPCRTHGFTIYKCLQKGAMKGIYYWLAPKEIVHSWVEVFYDNQWFNLEGFILDAEYLGKLQSKFPECSGAFCGYGAATKDFRNPVIDWNGNDTYIQKEGIAEDFGVYSTPDAFFSEHYQALNPFKKWMFQNIVRHLMNRNVDTIRRRDWVGKTGGSFMRRRG